MSGKQHLTDAGMLRLKAEELLNAKKDAEKKLPEVKQDTKRLLHELQVHQIELEMQNEELHQANEASEAALKKYTMLYDLAPMGYFTLESDGSISDLNFTGAELLGERRFSLVNSNFKLFIFKESLAVFDKFLKKVYSSQSKESCEVKLNCNGRSLCHVYMEGVVTGDDQKCLLSVVDISSFIK